MKPTTRGTLAVVIACAAAAVGAASAVPAVAAGGLLPAAPDFLEPTATA
ncbi:hypothetical protein AB0M19_13495 [Streptomyces sp. NPDC051920]